MLTQREEVFENVTVSLKSYALLHSTTVLELLLGPRIDYSMSFPNLTIEFLIPKTVRWAEVSVTSRQLITRSW